MVAEPKLQRRAFITRLPGPALALPIGVLVVSACGAAPEDVPIDEGQQEFVSVEHRFVALGDTGEGNSAQYAVSAAIESVCAARGGCDFALFLGDNFYDGGVDGVDDPQWQAKFEQPYANLAFPFFAVLGNHDYGELGLNPFLAQHQVDYSDQTVSKFTLPSRFYSYDLGTLELFALDTTALFVTGDGAQRDWGKAAVAESTATWKIAFAHHPYISNGRHGNAGCYELPGWWPWCGSGGLGAPIKRFVDDVVCGEVDIYLSGHDHNLQWLDTKCGTEFIVAGAGAKTTALESSRNDTFFETDTTEGFLLGEIAGNTFTGTFFDRNGNQLFTRTVTK